MSLLPFGLIVPIEPHSSCSFYETEPKSLAELQRKHWDPLHAWAQTEFGVTINKTESGFSIPKQDAKTYQVFDEIMKSFNQWEMAGTF